MIDVSPRIISGYRHDRTGLKELTTSSPTADLGCAMYQFLIGENSALKVMDDNAATATHVVMGIMNLDGVTHKSDGYLSNAEITAGSNHKLVVAPIGGIIFSLVEDGDGGNISNANAGPGVFADLVVANPGTAELNVANIMPYAQARADIRIDSSSVNASSSGLLVELLGLDPYVNQPFDNTGAVRRFLCKVIAAQATHDQTETF